VSEELLYRWGLLACFALSPVVLALLLFITAPYGRHGGAKLGPTVNATLGWVLMEAPAALAFAVWFLAGPHRLDPAALALGALWELHYLQRAFVFPFRRRGGAPMPALVMLSGLSFNLLNAWLNGRWLTTYGPVRGAAYLVDPRFLAGAALFLAGYFINRQADDILRNLRAPGETGYKVPRGGLYRWVSCPNYLGEIIEWCSFALAAWSPAGLAFALFTVANLAPRAAAHHRWYHDRFPDYPPERRALVPHVY
jgi:hypothetical protein